MADWECEEDCAVRRLGEQSGERPGAVSNSDSGYDGRSTYGKGWTGNTKRAGHNDKGTAARFYHNADWTYEIGEQLEESDNVRYQAKAAKKERGQGLRGFYWRKDKEAPIGFVRIDRNEWNSLPDKDRAFGNIHSTVKPIALTQWLAKLLLPPEAYAPRRILVPFGGVASEGIGAMLAGWDEVTLVELHSDYCNLARARLAWWAERSTGQMWPDVKEMLKGAPSLLPEVIR